MPDRDLPAPDSRTIVALSERVAVIETQQKSLLGSTDVIRTSMQAVNQEMQKFVAAEQKCGDALTEINKTLLNLPALTAAAHDFLGIRGKLDEVLDERQRDKGKRAAVALMGTLILGAVTIGGAIAGVFVWVLGHLK